MVWCCGIESEPHELAVCRRGPVQCALFLAAQPLRGRPAEGQGGQTEKRILGLRSWMSSKARRLGWVGLPGHDIQGQPRRGRQGLLCDLGGALVFLVLLSPQQDLLSTPTSAIAAQPSFPLLPACLRQKARVVYFPNSCPVLRNPTRKEGGAPVLPHPKVPSPRTVG